MMTAWNLTYGCDDEHVAQLGAWLDEFSYEKGPGAPSGTLRYKVSSILEDKDGSPGCFVPDCSFRITVDSQNEVSEPGNEGNNSAGGGCL